MARNNVFGLYLNSANTGGQTLVQNNRFQTNNSGFDDVSPPSASGNGIYTDQGLHNAVVKNNRFVGNRNAGFLVTSVESTDVNNLLINANTSVDDVSFVALESSNITNIRITGNKVQNVTQDTINGGSAIFIGGGNGVVVSYNNINKADYSGVAVRNDADNVDVMHNTINLAANNGIDVTTTTVGAVTVTRNVVTKSMSDGIFFASGTANNIVRFNRATGNGTAGNGAKDCRDDSRGTNRAGVANFWDTTNVGNTSSPPRLCHRP